MVINMHNKPTWQSIRTAANFADAMQQVNLRCQIGSLPESGKKLSGIKPLWTAEHIKESLFTVSTGIAYALPGAAVMTAGISAGGALGFIAAGIGLIGGKKLVDALATRQERGGFLLENPQQELPNANALPADMDDGNGKWWGQDVQDALDAHFAKFTEFTSINDGESHVSLKIDRAVRVVAMTESVNVTLYELEAKTGFDANRINTAISALSRDLKLPKGAQIMVEDNIGNGRIGLFIPKSKTSFISYHESKPHLIGYLPWAVGIAVSGDWIVLDITKLPHMIVGGETESGKSVALMMGILSMAFTVSPLDLRLHLADPKESSMPMLQRLPHVASIGTTAKDMIPVLEKLIAIYNKRKAMWRESRMQDANDLAKAGHHMPWHVLVIEEAATLIRDKTPVPGEVDENGKEARSTKTYGQWCEELLLELANKGRAARIHLILATQYFAKSIFDSELVANITAGICYRVDAYTSSKMIIKQNGGEKLMGNGDCMVKHKGIRSAIRTQGVYLDTPSIKDEVEFIRAKWLPIIKQFRNKST